MLPNISLVFVVPVLMAAARHGLVPSLWVSGLSVLTYNFFFLPPLYEFTIARSRQCGGAVPLHVRGDRRQRARRAHALADRGGAARGAHDRRALRLQPQDRGRHRALRSAVDRGYPSRPAAECRGRDADAGEGCRRRQARPAGRLSTRQRVQRRRPRRGALVVGCRPSDRPWHRHPARWTLAVRADQHQPLTGRRDRRAAAEGGTRARRLRAPAARGRRQPGRHRHRASHPGRRHRPGAPRRRARAAALGHADLGVARSAHAARLHHRRAVEPQELSRPLRRADARRASGHGAERGRTARSLRRQPARHDPARRRRHRAQARGGRCRRPRLDGVAPRHAAAEGQGRRPRGAARAAAALARLRAGRAGAVQPARQCREIFAARRPHRGRGAARRRVGRDRRARRGAGHSRRRRSTGCSTSSTGPMPATGSAPGPAWGSPSPRASSRPWAASSRRATGRLAERVAAARNSSCAIRFPDRMGG